MKSPIRLGAAVAVLLLVGGPVLAHGECGQGIVDEGEGCDEGSANGSAAGIWCTDECEVTPCGAPQSRKPQPAASDALFTLKAAVGGAVCDLRVCDVNDNGSVQASDALQVLRRAVGTNVTLACPAELPGETCVGRSFATIDELFEALDGSYVMQVDGGFGGLLGVYQAGTLLEMQVHASFLGKKAITTSVDHSTSYTATWLDGTGYSWEDLDHEVNVFFGPELGTTKILQCDKTTGRLTFVITAVSNGPNFCRLISEE